MGPWSTGEVEWLQMSPPEINSYWVQGSNVIRDEVGIVPRANLAEWIPLNPWLLVEEVQPISSCPRIGRQKLLCEGPRWASSSWASYPCWDVVLVDLDLHQKINK